MGLISKNAKVKWHSKNKKYYGDLGYIYTKIGDEFEVKIEDLPKSSHTKVECKCDGCGKDLFWTYNDYNHVVKEDGSTYCHVCGKSLARSGEATFKSFYDWCIENNRQDALNRWDCELNNCSPKDISYGTKKKYYFKCDKHHEHESELKSINIFTSSKSSHITCNQCNSFHQWCIENDKQDVLDRWDYEKNNCSPKDIPYSTNKKYYFKCNTHPEHYSESKQISSFTSGREGSIACHQCNSVAQYILDNFPDKDLFDVWDKNKNGDLDPWKVVKGCHNKIWVKCQEKDYHDSYEISCFNFVNGRRCPYCAGKKTHLKDSIGQYIVDNYGEDFLYKVWSDKNNVSPFEYSCMAHKEVWWKCLEGKHEDYLRSCKTSFIYEFRCHICVEELKSSVIEDKTKTYLKELGYEVKTEYECSIIAKNPKTKRCMPYDNEIVLGNGRRLIIEVHGEQHYKDAFYKAMHKCSDEEAERMLKQRKLYDRYKKASAEHYGYEYLELPYTVFDKNEVYKQMIDDKIKEILNNEKAS